MPLFIRYLILCCVLAGSLKLHAQSNTLKDIISLRDQGYNLRFKDTTRCIRLQQKALGMARQQALKEEMVISYVKLALSYSSLFDKKTFSIYTDSAYLLASVLKTPRSVAYGNMVMGFLKSSVGDKVGTMNYLLKAYHYFDGIHDDFFCVKIATQITSFFEFEDLKKQEKYATLVITGASKLNDPETTLQARGVYANLLIARMKAYHNIPIDSIIDYLKQTIVLANQKPEAIITKSNLAAMYLNISVLYYKSITPEREPLFWQHLDTCITLSKQYHASHIYARSMGIKGDFLMKKGDFVQAEKLFNEGIAYQGQLSYVDNKVLSMFYEALKEVAFKQQDYQKYYRYDTAFVRYNQLLYDETGQESLQNADVRFETANKVARISALEKENKLQTHNKWLGFGIAALLAAGLILMFSAYSFRRKYYRQSENVFKEKQKTTALELKLQKQETMEALTQKLSMERRLLQSQMDPHFVFNALGNIQSFVLQHETKNAVSYLSTFSKLMRQILQHSRKTWITLSDEADMLRNYIEMQKLRLNHSFDYTISTDDTLSMQTEIPPMLIQPIVENAIEHGLKPLDGPVKGLLRIHFGPDILHHTVVCTITDNGIGIEYSKKTKSGKATGHQSMAMDITDERIAKMAEQNDRTSITSRELKNESGHTLGTCVIIHLPFNYE